MNAAPRTRALGGFVLGLALLAASAVTVAPAGPQTSPAPVDLGTADPFAILAATGITNIPTSAVTGDVGLSPATGANITGLTCAEVNGTIYSVNDEGPSPCSEEEPALLTVAKTDLSAAHVDASGRVPFTTVPAQLGGETFTPGVYRSETTQFLITAGAGPLVLDAQGDPNGVFIFQSPADQAGSLTVGSDSEVQLTGGAQACNVWWAADAGGATINTGAIFKGNILAHTSITVATGANIEGRLLANIGNVTLDQDTITRADCAVPPAPPAPPPEPLIPPGPVGPPEPAEPPPAIPVPPRFTG